MLKKISDLKGYELKATDGKIGKVKELYFDDHDWTIRYLVANTGGWLSNRQVLISPYALLSIDDPEECIEVSLSKKKILDSPTLDTDKPVSKQFESSYYSYYNWPAYWSGPNAWRASTYMRGLEAWQKIAPSCAPIAKKNTTGDLQLRSTNAVTGYHIDAQDGGIGHVYDFIVDDENWTIRYLVIDTTNWIPGKKVLISPSWIEKVSWSESKLYINLTRESISNAPLYSESSALTRPYEEELFNYYNQKTYWKDSTNLNTPGDHNV